MSMIERYDSAQVKRQRCAALFATIAMGASVTACSAERGPEPPEPVAVATTEQAPTIPESTPDNGNVIKISTPEIIRGLGALAITGRVPETAETKYSPDQFGKDWMRVNGCDMRDIILIRDLTEEIVDDKCEVQSGKLDDPYTGEPITFERGSKISSGNAIDIDHVVALNDAWQKGAQQMEPLVRKQFANDGLNLQATKPGENRSKGDSDFADWQPTNRREWCRYVARQILVKVKYTLSVTQAEHEKMSDTLRTCPNQEFSLPN